MTTSPTRVASFFAPTRDADATDTDLLHRFTTDGDDSAFSAIVARHGPMVFGVCRRVLADWHLAEDAFQATFLVLARRANAISPPGAIAGWLHGVAYNVAKSARRAKLRRFQRERTTDDLPESEASPEQSPDVELLGVLDDELRKLPTKYRDLLVACDLEGRRREPVARSFDIPEGTLSSRLTAARKMLAERLTRRGIAPAMVAAIAAGSPVVVACEVPRAALATAARFGSNASRTVPEAVSTLAFNAIRAMTMRKFLPYSFLVLAATATLGLAAANLPTEQPPPEAPRATTALLAQVPAPAPAKTEPKPLPQGPNKLLVIRSGKLVLIDPDGKNEKTLAEATDQNLKNLPTTALLGPDGKTYVVQVMGVIPPDDGTPGAKRAPTSLHVRKLDDKDADTELNVQCQMFVWSPDGSEILCSEFEDGQDKAPETKHFLVNVKTKKRTDVKLPSDHIVTDWTRDGKYFVTTRISGDLENPLARLYLMNRDGTEHKALTGEKERALLGRISPDGKQALFLRAEFPLETPAEKKARQDAGKRGPEPKKVFSLLDIGTGKMTPIADVPLNAELQAYCWSPDSKKIAYSWREIHEGKPEDLISKETESHLIVCDPDGKNQRTILSEKGAGQWHVTLSGLDWR
jgi:RNA polymerase sigma factor (sigma-70 family)